tara:strand:- start:528 stop:944 length:417 start_codon:yes stop_codon:yes gene_type:complete
MAVASTNAWKVDIEETLQNAIRNEFKSSMPIFRDKENKIRGNQFAIIKGDNSVSDNNMFTRVSNAYNLTLDFFMLDRLRNENTVKRFFKTISRIEETIYSVIEIVPTYKPEVSSISYDDDLINGYRTATFNITIRSVR